MAHKGKLHFEISDWSKIKYMIKCTWGFEVGSKYPDPVIREYYFEGWDDMTEFVNEYNEGDQSINRKIFFIAETPRFFNVEPYEVATKFRVVAFKTKPDGSAEGDGT